MIHPQVAPDLSKLGAGKVASMRRELRRPVEVSGWIISDDGQSNPCTVSNLSPAGAKLTVLSRDDLPAEFDLPLLDSMEVAVLRSKVSLRSPAVDAMYEQMVRTLGG